MKKVLFVGMVFGALALTSCKRDYKCTYTIGELETVKKHSGLDKDEAATKKTQCQALGGVWSIN